MSESDNVASRELNEGRKAIGNISVNSECNHSFRPIYRKEQLRDMNYLFIHLVPPSQTRVVLTRTGTDIVPLTPLVIVTDLRYSRKFRSL